MDEGGKMNNKIVYLVNGEVVELLAEYKDCNIKKYVVKIFCGNEMCDNEEYPIYENMIVSNIYERYEDIPAFRKTFKLEKEIEKLKKQKDDLLKQINELAKLLNSREVK